MKVTIGNTTINYLVPALLAQFRQDIGKLLRLRAPFRFIKGSVDLDILQGTYRIN